MVSNRYALIETLFSGGLGGLYRAHDRYPLFGQVDVLLHFLPGHVFRSVSMSTLLDQLQTRCQQTNLPLLEVLDGGSAGEELYFVMRVPDGWTLSVLPVVRGKPTRLHLQAQTITAELLAQGLVKEGLDPQLFLVSPEGQLHLLGTALMPELQSLQAEPETLLTSGKVQGSYSARLFPLLLLCSTGALAAAGYGLYRGSDKPVPVPPVEAPVVSVRDVSTYTDLPPQGLSGLVTKPAKPADTGIMLVEAPPADRSALPGRQGQTMGLVSTAPKEAERAVPALPAKQPVLLAAEPAPKQSLPLKPAEAREMSALLLRIGQAIDNHHLQAALYSLRILQRRQSDHPKLPVLAGKIAAGYRSQAATDHSGFPERMAEGVEKEFGLTALVAGE